MVSKRTLAGLASAVVVGWAGAAFAHRMPEVYVILEPTEIEGESLTAVTMILHAQDSLALLSRSFGDGIDLADPQYHRELAQRVGDKLTFTDAELRFFGGEAKGNEVALFFTTGPDAIVEDSRILSSIHRRWTNRINDARSGDVVSQVFTQGGELHHHHH